MCMAYEFCLLFGITFIAAYLPLTLLQWHWPLPEPRLSVFQGYMFVVIGIYFSYFWSRGGQTLAMKTWRIRLVGVDGARVSTQRAVARYLLAWCGLIPGAFVMTLFGNRLAALGAFLFGVLLLFGWMIFDRDRQFLHDRILGTRLIGA